MKTLFLIVLMMLIVTLSFGQNSNVKCHLVIDQLTGLKSTDWELVATVGKFGKMKMKLTEYKDKDISMRLYIGIFRMSSRCFGADSKILIMSGKNVITLKLSGQNNCGMGLEDYAELSPDNIKLLTQSKISSIRVQYIKEFDDVKIDNKYSNYFIKTLPCFK